MFSTNYIVLVVFCTKLNSLLWLVLSGPKIAASVHVTTALFPINLDINHKRDEHSDLSVVTSISLP
jgi:hypothetical protein